jgi:PAS domain S-box-containing protein
MTERKKAELEQNRLAQDNRMLIATANAPIVGIDKEGRVNEWNLKAAEIVGYTLEEVMGRDLVEDFITPEYKAAVKEVLDNALQGRDTANFEFPLFTKDKARGEISLNATPRRDAAGNVVGVVGVGQVGPGRYCSPRHIVLFKPSLRYDYPLTPPIQPLDQSGACNPPRTGKPSLPCDDTAR